MKKYLLGTVAVVLAIGFSAFTTTKKVSTTKGTRALVWYEYQGAQSASARATETNYVKFATQPPNFSIVCPGADNKLCAIQVEDNGTNPTTFTTQFESDIESAVSGNTENSTFQMKL